MKKYILIVVLTVVTTVTFGQKKEKIKGSKIVTVEQKVIADFSELEVNDNIEVFLIKGEKCGLEIEADDNLHDIIKIELVGKNLRLSTLRNVSGYKKFIIRITYTSDFKTVISKNDAIVTALAEIDLAAITFSSFDYSKLFLNARVKNFNLKQEDKSKAELNLKSENTIVELSKNSHLKALINGTNLKLDLYQKSDAEIEGDIMDAKIRLDNNAEFTGKKLSVKSMDLITEADTNCSINVNTSITISASGSSEIEIYGEPKFDLKKFSDTARLIKKLIK
jgi:hypothetical protein